MYNNKIISNTYKFNESNKNSGNNNLHFFRVTIEVRKQYRHTIVTEKGDIMNSEFLVSIFDQF